MKAAMTITELLTRRGPSSRVTVLSSEELARVVGSGEETDWATVDQLNQDRLLYGQEVESAGRDLIKGLGNLEFGTAAEAFMRMQTASDREAAAVNALNRELEGHNQSVQEQRQLDAAVDASIEAGVNESREPNMTMNNGTQGYDGHTVVQVGNEAGFY